MLLSLFANFEPKPQHEWISKETEPIERNISKVFCQCIKSKLVAKGSELTFEPTVGNFDQEFIDNWYSSLKKFSVTLMVLIVTFHDKAIKKTNDKTDQTDSILKPTLEKTKQEKLKKLHQMKPQKRKFCVKVSSRNTTNLNTTPNLLFQWRVKLTKMRT